MTKAIRGTPKLVLTSQSGRRFTTSGFKVIKNGDNICGTFFIISVHLPMTQQGGSVSGVSLVRQDFNQMGSGSRESGPGQK